MEPNVTPDSIVEASPVASGETVSDLVHRHLRDEHHVTTDEELRNVKLDFHEDKSEKLLVVDPEVENETDDKNKLPGEKDIVFTPWNVVG